MRGWGWVGGRESARVGVRGVVGVQRHERWGSAPPLACLSAGTLLALSWKLNTSPAVCSPSLGVVPPPPPCTRCKQQRASKRWRQSRCVGGESGDWGFGKAAAGQGAAVRMRACLRNASSSAPPRKACHSRAQGTKRVMR